MPRVLHLLGSGDVTLAAAVIDRQTASGDTVSVALLPGTAAPPLPSGVRARRVPDELSYPGLLELIFEADHVISW